jgi:2-polyprenyl-6-methoxyphenol hydroxylase-like FAD-dependent oxidoreductase
MADQTHASDILPDGSDRGQPVPGAPPGGQDGVADYDVAVIGASLAGCTAAILLGRAGARVALVEKRPDPLAFKRVCTHFIQSSAIATLERLGLLGPMEAAGGQRTRPRIWSRWGWIVSSSDALVPSGINLRREIFDPMIRRAAADVPGVEPMLGWGAHALMLEEGRVTGVEVRDSHDKSLRLSARLVIGADGRDSRVAELASVSTRTIPHGRIAYGAYFEGPSPVGAPDGSAWFLDPDWAAAFPTDSGLTFYATMPTKERLPEFRRDPEQALTKLISELPDAPPILASRMVGSIVGKLDMPNVIHRPTAPGLALVGDAALATDPLWGVGCGWALQSSEWLVDSVVPALAGSESMEKGLERYRRRYGRALRGHMFLIHDYAGARKLNPVERMLFAGAARDARVARHFEAFGSRNTGPARMFASALPRAALVNARHALRGARANRAATAQPGSA